MAAATRASAATWQVGARTRAGHLEALGIELEERESGYYAGNYFCLRTGGTRPLMLYSNFDESS